MRSDTSLRQYVLTRSRQAENKYGPFLAELLKSEGFMGFEVVDLDMVPMPEFQEHDIIIVTRCYLRDTEFEKLENAAKQGASLIMIQPQGRFVTRFGWKAENQVYYPGYIRINNGYPGIDSPLQTHLPIPLYSANENTGDWHVVANALDSSWEKASYPAVVSRRMGSGKLTFLFYDLPETIAKTRFGNQALAGYNTAGFAWPHAFDLFAGHIDERLKHIPQADFHSQMFAKLLTETSPYPLPRFWYYEKTEQKTACIVQSDDDYSKPEDFEALANAVEKRNGAISFYLMENTKLSLEQANNLVGRGHSIAPHIDASGGINRGTCRCDDLYFSFPEQLSSETDRFVRKYGQHGSTMQPHCSPWPSYMDIVPVCEQNNYRLLFSYMCIFPCNDWIGNVERQAENWGNYLCGSGRPMKFCDQNGKSHNCWQQPLLFFDDETHIDFFALKERAVSNFARKLSDSTTNTYSTLSILSHPVSFASYSSPVWETVLDLLSENRQPIYSGDKWLDFIDRRSAIKISHEISGNALLVKVENLDGLLPLMFPVSGEKKISINGSFIEPVREKRLEEIYDFIQLDSAVHGKNINLEIR